MSVRSLLPAAAMSVFFAGVLPLSSMANSSPQQGAAYPKGQYAALDKLPDWGGVWVLNRPAPGAQAERPVFKGQYLKDYEAWQLAVKENNGMVPRTGSNCRPPGMPGMMATGQYPIEFLFTPGRITTHHEAWMQWRNIYTDGRGHPQDHDPGFFGHSIGRWEGETLVVDTVGIKTTVDLGMGMKHSDKLHVVERFYLAKEDPNTMIVDMVVNDPEALEKPWNRRFTFNRLRDSELYEFVCAENDRNPVDESGMTQHGPSE